MVIRIVDVASGANTSDQGIAVYTRLKSALASADPVIVSFDGVKGATSSFVNAGFVPLLSDFSLDELKQRLRIVNSTRQINDLIKSRLQRPEPAAA